MREHTRRRFAGSLLRLSALVSSASVIVAVAACNKGSSEGPPAPANSKGSAASPPASAASKASTVEPPIVQFDNGSYDIHQGDTLVGTLIAKYELKRETWVLRRSACELTTAPFHCDISGKRITRRPNESCDTWKRHVEADIGTDRVVYDTTYTMAPLRCGADCAYNPNNDGPSTFSMFPAGFYVQDGAARPRVAVDNQNGALHEYWFMDTFIGERGANIAPVTPKPESISRFACDACGTDAPELSVIKARYTSRSDLDCP